MDMKQWYLSRGIWGSVLVLVAMLLKVFGYEFSSELQSQTADLILNVVTLIGGAIALYGRVKATKAISGSSTVVKSTTLLLLILVLMSTTACPPSSVTMRQVAVASKDASIAISAFQDAEIVDYNLKLVSNTDHIAVQALMLDFGNVGLSLDAAIRAASTNGQAINAIDVALKEVQRLYGEGTLRITNPDTRTKYLIAMVGAQGTLNSIKAMLAAPKKGS